MSYPSYKPGIPASLLQSMRDALTESPVFLNPNALWVVFSQEELRPYRGRIPEGYDINSRVNLIISFLYTQYYLESDDTYVNALTTFLRAVAAMENEKSALKHQLEYLAETWDLYLQRSLGENKGFAIEGKQPSELQQLGTELGFIHESRKLKYLINLRQLLTTRFNISELRTLCFDLGVDYENLSGEGKVDKARELVTYFERHNRIQELLAKLVQTRPNPEIAELEDKVNAIFSK